MNAGSDTVRTLPVDRVQDLLKLQKAAHKINSILDLDQLIDKIANDIARSFGCVELSVFLHEAERGEMVLAGVHGCTLHGKGHRLKIGRDGLVGYVAATGQMRYAPDVRRDAYYMACEENTLSEVAIPLQVDGQLVGVFTASHPEVDGFPADQLRLLQGLCSHIAVAVQNARRFQQERSEREQMSREAQEARSIQQALLPKSSPFIPGFAVSGLSIPAGPVGGDWYDFIDLGDGRWGLVLADVSGKGTAAALLMSATRAMALIRARARGAPALGGVAGAGGRVPGPGLGGGGGAGRAAAGGLPVTAGTGVGGVLGAVAIRAPGPAPAAALGPAGFAPEGAGAAAWADLAAPAAGLASGLATGQPATLAGGAAALAVSGVPHRAQNLKVAAFSVMQFGHCRGGPPACCSLCAGAREAGFIMVGAAPSSAAKGAPHERHEPTSVSL